MNMEGEPFESDLSAIEYGQLADFRHRIRKFLHFSENACREHGVEPRQYQLLLTVKGLPSGVQPTIGELARRLFLKHHSTVELVDRLEKLEVVRRERNMKDAREVFIRLTPKGTALLRSLSSAHRRELESSGLELARALENIVRPKEHAA
jgi:DNA-binding MarR family transcriptional regulator